MQGHFSKILLSQTLCLGLLASSAFGENNATSELDSKLSLNTTLSTYELGAVEVTAPQEIDYNPSIQSTTFRQILLLPKCQCRQRLHLWRRSGRGAGLFR